MWGNADPLPDRCPSRPVPWATPLLLGPGGTYPGPPAGMGMGGGPGTRCCHIQLLLPPAWPWRTSPRPAEQLAFCQDMALNPLSEGLGTPGKGLWQRMQCSAGLRSGDRGRETPPSQPRPPRAPSGCTPKAAPRPQTPGERGADGSLRYRDAEHGQCSGEGGWFGDTGAERVC